MDKVESKLLQIKKDLQKILKEKDDRKEDNQEEERTKQTDIIVKKTEADLRTDSWKVQGTEKK